MGYRLNRLDEPVFIAVSKPLPTEFGIHHRLESCVTCLQAVGESKSNISFAEIPNAREIFQLSHSRAKYASFGVATFKIVQVSQKG